MAEVYVLVVLAKGAEKKTKEGTGEYYDTDADTQLRIEESVDWSEQLPEESRKLWAFGAGTEKRYRQGKTLATLMSESLRYYNRGFDALVNKSDHHFYGTFEEMKWVIEDAMEKSLSPSTTRFVFFTQRRQIPRVRLIWWLFYQKGWGRAEFVVTKRYEQITWGHELMGVGRVLGLYLGFIKPRSAFPYPPVSEYEEQAG